MTVANKYRAEVALPQAGEGAYLRFTVDSLEKLEGIYGKKYFDAVLTGLRDARIKCYKDCLAVSLQTKDPVTLEAILNQMPMEDLQMLLVDAIYLTVFGRNFKEQEEYEDKLFKERVEKAKDNPRMAAALYSQMSGKQDTGQD